MFSIDQIHGLTLPYKTLCLTFDDGPGDTEGDGKGPKTLKLAQYLDDEKIKAAFFCVGMFVLQHRSIVAEVAKMGHVIGNHTFLHSKRLPILLSEGWDIASEITLTDELIKEFIPDNTVYFRAPWGCWSKEVADNLNANVNNELNHIGSFSWDFKNNDFGFWNDGKSAKECADDHYEHINERGKGLLLMHDSTADIETARNNNLTYETMRILIPRLKDAGYKFVGIDQIQIAD